MSAPEISVVIPTRNRETRLRFALEALRDQSLDRDRYEVIVVRADDGEIATEAPGGLDARFLSCPPGPARQRNAGWRAATAPLIAFTDDDCRPSPGWLEALLEAAARADVGADDFLQGRTRPDPGEEHLLHGRARSIDVDRIDGWFPTCNIAYPRTLLERLGGFDETFPTAWGEDTDLGQRALEQGSTAFFIESALVHHAVNARTLREALREARRRDDLPRVLARHPQQRRGLFLGTFVRRSHARFLLALAGLLVIRRHPLLGAIALYPYLSNRRGPLEALREAPKILTRLPARALVDATEVAVTARAAARHRVPVI